MTADHNVEVTGGTFTPFISLLTEGRELPAGYAEWGFKIVRPDLRSFGGYRWPFPPGVAADEGAVADGDPCPTAATGGLCVAKTLEGAASCGHGHSTILLLAYNRSDVLGESARKLRVRRAAVVDLVDAVGVYMRAAGANLKGANLKGADLAGADLRGADLRGADLRRADLAGADLRVALLRGADLRGADLRGARLL